jgi:hypothetical protein
MDGIPGQRGIDKCDILRLNATKWLHTVLISFAALLHRDNLTALLGVTNIFSNFFLTNIHKTYTIRGDRVENVNPRHR